MAISPIEIPRIRIIRKSYDEDSETPDFDVINLVESYEEALKHIAHSLPHEYHGQGCEFCDRAEVARFQSDIEKKLNYER